MIIRLLLVLMGMVLLAGVTSAQSNDERLRLEDEERTRQVLDAAQTSAAPPYQNFVSQLMPASEGAWLVSIGRRGGLTGNPGTLLTALNSSGIRACSHPQSSFSTELIDLSLVEPIETAITGLDLKDLNKNFSSEKNFCSDCQIYSMEITYREKKKAKSYLFEWTTFPESGSQIRSLYQTVLSSAKCA